MVCRGPLNPFLDISPSAVVGKIGIKPCWQKYKAAMKTSRKPTRRCNQQLPSKVPPGFHGVPYKEGTGTELQDRWLGLCLHHSAPPPTFYIPPLPSPPPLPVWGCLFSRCCFSPASSHPLTNTGSRRSPPGAGKKVCKGPFFLPWLPSGAALRLQR